MHKNRVDCCGLPDVRYAPDSDQIPQRSEMTLCAKSGRLPGAAKSITHGRVN
jgi:hypothetical protein